MNEQECGSWLKSWLTSGASTMARIFFIGPAAAFFIASFTSAAVVDFFTTTFRSTSDTFGVGTRTDTPSSLPFSSGITRPTAFAAPVEVGIMESAAARPR